MRKLLIAVLTAGLLAPLCALATPAPVKSVPDSYYSGRWYEIARTPALSERNCDGVTYDFAGTSSVFNLNLTCRKGAPSGPREITKSTGRAVAGSNGGRFKLTFTVVVPITVEYWVLECAEDHSWFIMARDNGKYVWIVSRRPVMETALRDSLVNKIKTMGLKTDNLEFPDQPPSA